MKSLLLLATSVASSDWADSDRLSELWSSIASASESQALEFLLVSDPSVAFARSSDGRGGVWWGWEYGNLKALSLLKAAGADLFSSDADANGISAKELCRAPTCNFESLSAEIENETEAAAARLEQVKALIAAQEGAWEEDSPPEDGEILPEQGVDVFDEDL